MVKPFVHIVFGARQTGKSTLIKQLLPPDALVINLSEPQERMKYLSDPQELIRNCRALKKPANRAMFLSMKSRWFLTFLMLSRASTTRIQRLSALFSAGVRRAS